MSAKSAALKLNGIFLGFIGNFEKFTDLSPADRIFAEILPESGDFYPLSCVLDENFFKAPPDFCDVYMFEGGAIVQVTAFPARARELKVLRQERMDDALLTLYSEGDLKLSVERQNKFALTVLPREFEDCELSSQKLGGEVFFCASAPADGETELIVFSGTPEKTFVSRVLEYSFTDCLKTKIAYHDPAGHVAETEWAFSNGAFVMRRYSVTAQKRSTLPKPIPRSFPYCFSTKCSCAETLPNTWATR